MQDAEPLLALSNRLATEQIGSNTVQGTPPYEVEKFLGQNAGLLVGGIELASEDEVFAKPSWVGCEVGATIAALELRYCMPNTFAGR